jgi:hypothetical protein
MIIGYLTDWFELVFIFFLVTSLRLGGWRTTLIAVSNTAFMFCLVWIEDIANVSDVLANIKVFEENATREN